MARPGRIAHQPGLDGVRALAVVAVLAYHDGRLSGGFLGVSTFFTLSGFLITWLLLAEHAASGRVGLRSFFARRLRRLLPAALAGVALAAAVTPFTAGPQGAGGFRGDGLAALANVANWRFLLADRSYADAFAAPSAVLHYWSLAVEEQFYLVLAPAIVGILALARGRPRLVVGVLVAAAGASFAAGWALVGRSGIDRAYYGTDVRALEFLVGALVAVVVTGAGRRDLPHLSRRAGAVVAAAGPLALGGLVVATARASETDPSLFRGGLLAYAVLSSVVLVATCVPGPLRSVLSWPALRALGRVSYGVYVYHWPLFLLLDPPRTGLDGVALTAVRLAATFGVAAISFVVLERPIREGRRVVARRSPAVVSSGVAAAVGAVVVATAFAPPPAIVYAPVAPAATAARDVAPPPSAAPGVGAPDPERPPDVPTEPGTRLLVVGDSIALTLGRGIERWGAAHGVAVRNGAALGCHLLYDAHVRGYWGVDRRDGDACLTRETWPAVLDEFRPHAVVVLYGAWDVYDASWDGGETWHAPGDPEWDRRYAAAVADAATRLASTGARVLWLAAPCFEALPGDRAAGGNWYEPRRVEALGDIARSVATGTGMLVSATLAETGCPVDFAARPDGAHFADAGADAAAAALEPDLLRALAR